MIDGHDKLLSLIWKTQTKQNEKGKTSIASSEFKKWTGPKKHEAQKNMITDKNLEQYKHSKILLQKRNLKTYKEYSASNKNHGWKHTWKKQKQKKNIFFSEKVV